MNFGYAKTVDVSTYERNKEAADNENKYILHCMNTGKICIFTKDGKMHQVKVMDIPYGKFRDKGQPIDNISNYDSTQGRDRVHLRLRTDAVCEAFICHKAGDDQEG